MRNIFENYMSLDDLDTIVEQFRGTKTNFQTGDEITSADLMGQLDHKDQQVRRR